MNRLEHSLSPYLLQHKNNPVDWFPWGDEAFELAKQTDRPIFLSVGYAACHWCHVMEHESFENASIARFLNDRFVSIKVDREERPDIDQIYMNAVQLMTGRGGWPMSVFLNHDHQPFYAGTYWPPESRQGMPGFAQVLDAIAGAWQDRRAEVNEHAIDITKALEQLAIGTSSVDEDLPSDDVISGATDRLIEVLDRRDGGFGGAPKFPHATDLQLLLSRGLTTQRPELVDAAEFTLDKMAAGGIRDHIGGGFSRYSVDARWLVPHFEKMLYDNALLAEASIRAYQVTGHERHQVVACETLDYLCREMVDPAGGFHCSEDADSEGVEGKYYVWSPAEVIQVLGPERGQRFCEVYDITEGGNFEGASIANLPRPFESEQEAAQWASDREQLRLARESRIHPGRDDKILVAWNSLAIKSLSIAGSVLGRQDYIDAATRSAEFMLEKMVRSDGRLLHAYRDGRAHLDGYVDDYAFAIESFIALFEATGRARWIGRATKLADMMLKHFMDDRRGGFFYTADDAETLITRTKDWHDGSLVSGNASAVMGLLKLSSLCGRDDFREAAEAALRAAGEVLKTQAAACGALLLALDRCHHADEQWVLAVPNMEQMAYHRQAFLKTFRPHTTCSWVVGDAPDSGPVVSLNSGRSAIDGRATLYKCREFVCQSPETFG